MPLLANCWIYSSGYNQIYTSVAHLDRHDTGLVLGTSPYTHEGFPNLLFEYRMQAAAKVYRAGKIKHILVSGTNPGHYYNEPKAMFKSLVKLGIPAEAIQKDTLGDNTLTSIIRSKLIYGLDHYVIISQRFHDYRALFFARQLDISAVAYAHPLEDTRQSFLVELREYLARFKAVLSISFYRLWS